MTRSTKSGPLVATLVLLISCFGMPAVAQAKTSKHGSHAAKKHKKKKKSNRGPRGFTGPTGLTGPAGPAGRNGTNGTNGTNGINGTNGTNGTNGMTGPAGPFPGTLPTGKTVTGNWSATGVATAASQYIISGISYGYAFATAPTVSYRTAASAPTAGCPGSLGSPTAASGNVCVYEADASGAGGPANATGGTCDPATTGCIFASSNKYGIGVYALSLAAGQVFNYGTWAATGN